MFKNINTYLERKNFLDIFKDCEKEENDLSRIFFQELINNVHGTKYLFNKSKTEVLDNFEIDCILNEDKKINVFICSNYLPPEEMVKTFNRQTKDGEWDNIRLVSTLPADYYVIINRPNFVNTLNFDFSKTIIFHMEPYLEDKNEALLGDWKNVKEKFPEILFYGNHREHHNNLEWHLLSTYNELKNNEIVKEEKNKYVISSIISEKNTDPGHKKRSNFLKYLENKGIEVHIYGSNKLKWKHYKGSLPYKEKDNGLFPYYYTFNAENNKINNYFTEKVVDGILSECLTIYWGCPNINEYISDDSIVYLELKDFEKDYYKVKKILDGFEWEKRISSIKKDKNKILDEMQFLPRLSKIINENKD